MEPITIQLDPGFALQADIIGHLAQKLREGGVPLEPRITSGIASMDAPWLSRRLGELGYTWRADKWPDGSVRIEVWKEDPSIAEAAKLWQKMVARVRGESAQEAAQEP